MLLIILILFVPFLQFVILAGFYPQKSRVNAWMYVCNGILLGLLGTLVLKSGLEPQSIRYAWMQVGDFSLDFGLSLDKLSYPLLFLVVLISFLVQVFSTEYMQHERRYARYFAFLGLFTFSMIGIVLASNLLLLYFFWELVGLSSYLLIGFWFSKEAARQAARKAFLLNRVGDAAFLIGIILCAHYLGTLEIDSLLEASLSSPVSTPLTLIGICLLGGALGKSAQFPLYIWLPDAMEGPTPVSALIHAATMVAAGIYLIARIFGLLSLEAGAILASIGGLTIVIGALAALAQQDIKKVLAYSTISQLGYMVLAMGTGAYTAGLFHLFTHAFFKAGLFLGAGSLIHSLHEAQHKHHVHWDAQDIRLMGGLRKKMPFTALTFAVCSLALMGFPLTSGFLSKDAILSGSLAWASQQGSGVSYLLPFSSFLGVVLTAWYMAKTYYRVFEGHFRGNSSALDTPKVEGALQEGKLGIKLPLIILAAASIFLLFGLNPIQAEDSWLWHIIDITPEKTWTGSLLANGATLKLLAHEYHTLASVLSLALLSLGVALAVWTIRRNQQAFPAEDQKTDLKPSIWSEAFYLDRAYRVLILQGGERFSMAISRFDLGFVDTLVNRIGETHVVFSHIISWLDRTLVDGLINFIAKLANILGSLTRSGKRGKVQNYIRLTIIIVLIGFFWLLL